VGLEILGFPAFELPACSNLSAGFKLFLRSKDAFSPLTIFRTNPWIRAENYQAIPNQGDTQMLYEHILV